LAQGPASKQAYRELLFHDLRRTAARNMRRAGIAEGIIMEIRCWRPQSVFETCVIISQQDIRDAVRKLETSEIGHIIAMIV
jgi:hypothetical protein